MSETTNQSSKTQTRKKALTLFFCILCVIALAFSSYWFFFLRNYEKTDDAYVAGNQIMLSSQVNGNIRQINADNMDFVKAGDVLIELDDTDLALNFEQAKNILATTVRQLSQLQFTVKQLESTLQAKRVTLEKAKGDLQRREQLYQTAAIDKESYQHAKSALFVAQADFKATENQLAANKAMLMNVPLTEQPDVLKAASQLTQAWVNLQRAKVIAPTDGYVARRSAQVGQKVSAGTPLFAIIPPQQMWVEANFKETQLRYMRLGQPVQLVFDLYGEDVEFNGVVEGIDMGTGSAFSLLPTQNATGNWIKVVQRVPVRIALDPEQLQKHPLRIGLSSIATVNISGTEGAVLKPQRQQTLYSTDTLVYDQSAVKNLIDLIIQQNSHAL